MHKVTFKAVGPPSVPQDIKRLRRESMDYCRKHGQPVIFRHMWSREDVIKGVAKECPACFDSAYGQVRNDCPVCFGFGFVSVEDSIVGIDPVEEPPAGDPEDTGYWTDTYWDNAEFVDTNGRIVHGIDLEEEDVHIRAPRYGGFGEPWLTWMVEPDVAVDVFRINEQGVLVQTYDAQGVAPWYPELGDNDLVINVELAPDDFDIVGTQERFQLKRVQQVTMRGYGKRGRPHSSSGGQSFKVQQTFEMSKAPDNTSLYNVSADPP